MFVSCHEGGFTCHVSDVEPQAVAPLADGDSRAAAGMPGTVIEGLPARLTVRIFDVGARVPQGNL